MNRSTPRGPGRRLATIGAVALNSPTLAVPTPRTHWFDVPGGHRLHVHDCGAPDGRPALVLHGGPGTGASPRLWEGFDLARWRVIVPDQRGAGASAPRGDTAHNRTPELLADLRALRRALGVPRWLVMGGSWGAALALAHALDAPDAVDGLLLRSPFLARAVDVQRFFTPRPGLDTAWQRLLAVAGPVPLPALHAALRGEDAAAATRAAQAWWQWECALQGHRRRPEDLQGDALAFQTDRLRVQAHYLVHHCWLAEPPLLERCGALAGVPALLIQGREDRICPPDGAALLHAALPGSRLQWVDGAGHDPGHPGLVAAVAQALAGWAARQAWP